MAKVLLITDGVAEASVSAFLSKFDYKVVSTADYLSEFDVDWASNFENKIIIEVESFDYACELAASYYDSDPGDTPEFVSDSE